MVSFSVTKAKVLSFLQREKAPLPDKFLSLAYKEGVPITGTPVKVVITKGASSCNHITIVATEQLTFRSSTRRYHLNELKLAMDNTDLDQMWDALFAQIKPVCIKNADKPMSIIKSAVEAVTYTI